ncbi:helix-turn-helix domain-containing protein [Mesorhizobium sp. AR07]|uniref:helix-turn-helix domain-containing protein n=1 Tax=Mesorhizobium sp. AR07 TaxID=2865838 RepID=UPI002160AE9F|nr:helix-turn-helix domain-containing protein [Mesorhizobium sp. AR07]
MSDPNYLTPEEVIARYRGQLSEGTLRNWRYMRIGPSFLKIGKAILYPSSELDRWDRSILVVCRPTRNLPFERTSAPE